MWQPFHVRFFMESELVAPDGVRLDALLMYHYVNKYHSIDIPLSKYAWESAYFYAASQGFYDDDNPLISRDTLFKKTDAATYLPSQMAQVNSGSGDTASAMRDFEKISTEYVDFYGCGDVEIVQELLRNVSSLGGMRKNGYGAVSPDFKFEILPQDFSLFKDDLVMRDVPISLAMMRTLLRDMADFKFIIKQIRIIPPYHDRIKEGKYPVVGAGSSRPPNLLYEKL